MIWEILFLLCLENALCIIAVQTNANTTKIAWRRFLWFLRDRKWMKTANTWWFITTMNPFSWASGTFLKKWVLVAAPEHPLPSLRIVSHSCNSPRFLAVISDLSAAFRLGIMGPSTTIDCDLSSSAMALIMGNAAGKPRWGLSFNLEITRRFHCPRPCPIKTQDATRRVAPALRPCAAGSTSCSRLYYGHGGMPSWTQQVTTSNFIALKGSEFCSSYFFLVD